MELQAQTRVATGSNVRIDRLVRIRQSDLEMVQRIVYVLLHRVLFERFSRNHDPSLAIPHHDAALLATVPTQSRVQVDGGRGSSAYTLC